jgi:hypothetical protein
MKSLWLTLAVILAGGLTLLSGVTHGRLRNRWGASEAMQAASEQLKRLPTEFGQWQCQSTQELDAEARDRLECLASVCRRYVDRQTGDIVELMLVLGPAGPIAVHTPEVCVASQACQPAKSRTKFSLSHSPGGADDFWQLTYPARDLYANSLRVYYGWSSGARWSAPSDARFTFAGCPYLYVIQLSSPWRPEAGSGGSDPGAKFLQDFVSAAKPCLVEPFGH